jgi:hypothetical protein
MILRLEHTYRTVYLGMDYSNTGLLVSINLHWEGFALRGVYLQEAPVGSGCNPVVCCLKQQTANQPSFQPWQQRVEGLRSVEQALYQRMRPEEGNEGVSGYRLVLLMKMRTCIRK